MKNWYIPDLPGIMVVIALTFLPGSCLEYTVNSEVNRDGSIIREITARGDSSNIFRGSLMIPSGKLWKIFSGFEENDKQKKASERQYFYTASRKFNNVNELNDWLASDTSSHTIKIKVNLRKSFRWFYSYFEYTEKYPMTFPFRNVPVDSFLTLPEQSYLAEDGRTIYSPHEKKWMWKTDTMKFQYDHSDSLELKKMDDNCNKKLEQWMTSSIVSEFCDIIKLNFAGDTSFAGIRQKMDGLIETIHYQVYNSNDSALINTLIQLVDSISQSKKLSDLFERNPFIFSDLDSKLKCVDKYDYTDDYECNLKMPGQVYSTNAFDRDAERLNWKFGPMLFFMKDFEMKAESRVPNPWIMILTGIAAVLMISILVSRGRPTTKYWFRYCPMELIALFILWIMVPEHPNKAIGFGEVFY